MNNQANNLTPIDSKKPTTKQDLIAANIKPLDWQLEAGQSEPLTNYLTVMSRLEVIQHTSSVILAALEPHAQIGAENRKSKPQRADIAA